MAKNTDVSTRRNDISKAVERGRLPHDLLGGTTTMQEAGTRYVPHNPSEPKHRWDARVKAGVLMNQYARTVEYLSGQAFSRPVAVEGDSEPSETFRAMFKDIDLQGHTLTEWSREFFEDAINFGVSWVLVEYPQINMRTEGDQTFYEASDGEWLPKTAESDATEGWKPYFCIIPQSSVLGYRYDTVGGQRVLAQFRFKETVVDEPGQFDTDDKMVEQVRVLYPGRWEIWRQNTETKEGDWTLYDEGTTSIGVIPAQPLILGKKCGEACAYPTLEDLAHLNRLHWQGTVDQIDLMSWVRRPAWVGRMLWSDEEAQAQGMKAFGNGVVFHSNFPEGGLENVGIDPNSAQQGREDLDNTKTEMSMFGMRLLMPRTGDVTATQNAMEASENDSTLKAWVGTLTDVINRALVYAGMWVGEDEVPTVTVNTEFHLAYGLSPEEMKYAVEAGFISKEMAFDEFKRRGYVPDSSEWAEVQAQIENEARAGDGPGLTPELAANMLG